MLCKFEELEEIKNYHMGYRVDPDTQNVTFLYELKEGACSNSFGIQVAKLAGIPDFVVKCAQEKSSLFAEKLKGYEKALLDINKK